MSEVLKVRQVHDSERTTDSITVIDAHTRNENLWYARQESILSNDTRVCLAKTRISWYSDL